MFYMSARMMDVVTILPLQAGLWLKSVSLVQWSAATCVLFSIHHMNLTNSHNGSVTMTAP